MKYEINEKQLKSINIMIKLMNLALQRNTFSEDEKKLIFDKLSDITQL